MKTLKAMVIDDDPGVLHYLRYILERRGYEVLAFEDSSKSPLHKRGGRPCQMHDSECPDLIITDLIMPRVNGVDLLESVVKKGCRCRHLALVSGTAITEKDSRRMAKYGARFFSKPLDLSDFYNWLEMVEKEIAGRPSV
ncbi:MAG: response regulator [bacterium]|jgi:CheY-like chemotaxis protein